MDTTTATETWIRTQDYHMHSNWSDGEGDLYAVLARCRALGLKRFAIADHVEYDHHSDVSPRWSEYRKAVAEVQARAADQGIEMLLGIETGVDSDGNLLAPDEIVHEVDFVICSVHTVRGVPEGLEARDEAAYWQAAREQIEAAIRCEHVDIIGHIEAYLPSEVVRTRGETFDGRRAVEREIAAVHFPLDWYKKIAGLAREHGVAVEIHGMSATPRVEAIRLLRDAGAKVSIGSDGHRLSDIGRVDHAVHVAHALGLTTDDFFVPARREK